MQNEKEKLLLSLSFVYLSGGKVKLGTKHALPCRLEGVRKNETPERIFKAKAFWINKYCVTNSDFEKFNPEHKRPLTALNDKQPVTDVTYMDALTYIKWLSQQSGLDFRLPTEIEWTFAAAPFGWEFPYRPEPEPSKGFAHTFDPNLPHTLEVDDLRFGANIYGLYHMAGNVFEMTEGWYYSQGHFGAGTDGVYYLAKGGDYGHCQYSAGVQRRVIFDIADRSTRVGFRLAHSAF